jgi:hypothetical protein
MYCIDETSLKVNLPSHLVCVYRLQFSGHEGVWVETADDAQVSTIQTTLQYFISFHFCQRNQCHSPLQVLDKKYYEAIYLNAWRPRNAGAEGQDWTTGNEGSNDLNPRMMLNSKYQLLQFDSTERSLV